MNSRAIQQTISFIALWLTVCCLTCVGLAQTTSFTYQGRLTDNSLPANGPYDFQFKLFDAVGGGTQVGATVSSNNVTVSGGAFTVTLDFGASTFTGAPRFLEISVRQGAAAFTTLNPLQPITSTPYAIRSLTAGDATQLGGVAAARFVQSDAMSNVSIGGNLTVSGTFSTDIVNAQTQYNLGGQRILSNAGDYNLFVGKNAGTVNAGSFNTFVGNVAGGNNTTGSANSFFGNGAGLNNTTGSYNSYFGNGSGIVGTTANDNSFFGHAAGSRNTASNNVFFGSQAGFANTTGALNTFVGSSAGLQNTVGTSNSFFGASSGVKNTASFNSFFGTYAGQENTTGNYNTFVGISAGVANTIPGDNSFFGALAGAANTTGTNNTFVGAYAGGNCSVLPCPNPLIGNGNSFFGARAGFKNTTSSDNSFFGANAGLNNTVGGFNAFFGSNAGFANVDGAHNSFFGTGAGYNNTSGGFNSFFGKYGGLANTTGSYNSFYGVGAGESNTTGSNNTMIGNGAGNANVTGSNNAIFGYFAGFSNTASGNAFFGSEAGRNNTSGYANAFFGIDAGKANTTGINNVFVGRAAGLQNTNGSGNSFLGDFTGGANSVGNFNSFFGDTAGFGNTIGYGNSFFGRAAGTVNTTGYENTVVGDSANVGANNLNFASAFGASAVVNFSDTIVLGKVAGTYNGVARQADTVQIPGALSLGSVIFPQAKLYVSGGTSWFQGDSTPFPGVAGKGVAVGFSGEQGYLFAYDYGSNTPKNLLLNSQGGNVGIGTATANSRLTVAGLIESTSGGFKFPDGTTQTTAALGVNAILNQTTQQAGANFNISGNGTLGGTLTAGTLSGNGSGLTNLNASNITTGTLANARFGLIPTANLADSAVTAPKIAAGQVVKTLNGLTDAVTLAEGSNISITPSGNTLTIAATGGGGGASLTVKEEDGTPSVASVTEIRVSNGTLTNNGAGSVSITTGGGSNLIRTDGLNAGLENLLVGINAGGTSPTTSSNNFNNTIVGNYAGENNSIGAGNSFLGFRAGRANTSGNNNVFVGSNAGVANTVGTYNVFVGVGTGGGATSSNNVLVGAGAGSQTLNGGNTFIGYSAGMANRTGTSNTLLGINANVLADNLTYATAIGADAIVDASNKIVLGRPVDTVSVPGTFTNPSDARLKTGVTNLQYGLHEVLRLRPVTWHWKDSPDGKLRLGLIAQEVEIVLPELIEPGAEPDRLLSLNYLGLLPVVIRAIQEQAASITALKVELAAQRQHRIEPVKETAAQPRVEAPAMPKVYSGTVKLDARGEALLTLPADYVGLNCDFHYQLTAIGAPGPNLYIAERIKGGRFKIAGGRPGLEVSWQITVIHQSASAQLEEEKPRQLSPPGRH